VPTRSLGWKLVSVLATLLLAMTVAIFVLWGSGEAGTRVLVRATARTSLAAFVLAYAASALRRTTPGAVSSWLVRNRRALGLTFAVSQTIHLGALARLSPHMRPDEGDALTTLFGGIAFAFTYAMAATSNAPSVARLGAPRWKKLHTFGMHYIAFIFAFTFAGVAAAGGIAGWIGLAALAAALTLRIASRSRRPAPVAST